MLSFILRLSILASWTTFPGPHSACAEGDPAHLELVGKLGSGDRKEREVAQATLAAIGPDAGLALQAGLDSSNSQIRAGCARLLGKLKVREARQRLTRLALEEEFLVSWQALDALAEMAEAQDVEIFAQFFSHPASAADAPETRGGSSTAEVQKLALRRSAAVGLYHAGGQKALELLREGLRDAEPLLRGTCAFGLGYLKDSPSAPLLIDALGDDDAGVREKADLALQWISGRQVGFDPSGLPLKREAAIERWRSWWRETSSSEGR